jgi:signal transduction histidine kinase
MSGNRRGAPGVRRTLTIITAVVTFFALGATVVGGLLLLRRTLRDQLDEQLRDRVEDTVEHLAEVGLDQFVTVDAVPVPFGGENTFAAVWDDVGVVTRNEIPAAEHLEELALAEGRLTTIAMPELIDLVGASSMRVAVDSLADVLIDWDDQGFGDAELAPDDQGEVMVAVGVPLADTDRLVRQVGAAGATLVVVLTTISAALVWFVTGRSLAPVDRLREQADAITATDLHRRLPDPGRPDELGRLTTTLNGMLERLDGAHRAQRQFVSDASHELRNPIAAAAAGLEVGLRRPEETDWPVVARTALVDIHRVRRLVDDLLVLARSDEGALSISRELIDLDDVVLTQVSSARAFSPVPIDTSAVSAAAVNGDPLRLGQVVGNLLANAGRHARTGVAVSVIERSGTAWVCVDDDGPGVPVAERTRVFERFTRLDVSRERDRGGSGLGLAICREVIVAHGGEIGVTDAPGGGARFWFKLAAPLA